MNPGLERAVTELVAAIASRTRPLTVAIDGRSGAGKSTVATLVGARVGATVIATDDFYAATVPDADWDRRSPAQRADECIDWRRLRAEVIEPLRAGRSARWRPFDFAAGPRPDGTYGFRAESTVAVPTGVTILDGAYSARPELADVLDLTVLITVPESVRRARLAARERPEFLAAWHARWDEAEAHYFGQIRPPATFDMILDTDEGSRT